MHKAGVLARKLFRLGKSAVRKFNAGEIQQMPMCSPCDTWEKARNAVRHHYATGARHYNVSTHTLYPKKLKKVREQRQRELVARTFADLLRGEDYGGYEQATGATTRSEALRKLLNYNKLDAAFESEWQYQPKSQSQDRLRRSVAFLAYEPDLACKLYCPHNIIPVYTGGTGTTTAASARTNLGVDQGKSADITVQYLVDMRDKVVRSLGIQNLPSSSSASALNEAMMRNLLRPKLSP